MKEYSVEAKNSQELRDNYIQFYKEDDSVWIGIGSMELREFSTDEVKEIIEKLKECISE